jgi:hypothetical protein
MKALFWTAENDRKLLLLMIKAAAIRVNLEGSLLNSVHLTGKK